jgi:Spy/CpxP family protein refolding chaperone
MTGPGSRGDMPTGATAPAGAPNPRLIAGVVVVLALLTGFVAGAFVGPRLGLGRGEGRRPYGFGGRGPWGRGGGGPGGPSDRMRQHFQSELGLSAAQMAQVDTIMTQSMAERRALEDSVRPRIRAQVDSTRARIERILTPEQRQKFEALHRERMAREGGGGPDDGRGPPGAARP